MANLGKVSVLNTDDRILNQLQDNFAQKLNNILALPFLQGNFLDDVVLASGDNTINHKLGRDLVGWVITLQNASATIYDKQDSNTDIANTLVLNSSAIATVTIYVF
jgi:hypothetical protein